MSDDIERLSSKIDSLVSVLEQHFRGDSGGLGGSLAGKKFNAADLDAFVDRIKKTGKQFGMFDQILKKNASVSQSVMEDLEKLDEQIISLTESTENAAENNEKAAAIIAKRREIAQAAADATMKQSFSKLGASGMKMGSMLAAGVGKVISGLTGSGTAFEISSGIMSAGLDMAGEASKAAGSAAGSLGQVAMTSTNPAIKGLGTVAAVAGPLLGSLGDAASKAAKFGIDVLTKEVEKTVKAFHATTAAGAVFANGMDDIRKYSGMAGLTLDQFSNVIKNNAGALAEAGYTVTDGAKIVANVTGNLATQTGKSGKSLQAELQNLGFGFEEQAGLVAEMSANLRKSGGTASNGQMAQATAEMGRNMRVVADIMGEDAKAKKDAAKKQAEAYAFDVALRKRAKETNDPGLITRTHQAMALMSDSFREGYIQQSVLGTVTSKVAHVLGQTDDIVSASNATFNTMNPTLEQINAGQAKYNDTLVNGTNATAEAVSKATIATGALAEFSTAAGSNAQDALKNNTENATKAVAAVQEATKANGEFQESVMGAEREMQKFKIELQNSMYEPMKDYAKFTREMLASMRAMINEATKGANGKAGEGLWDKTKRYGSKALERGATGATIGGVAGGVVGAVGGLGIASAATAPAGYMAGSVLGGIAGAVEGIGEELYSDIFSSDNVAKKANGGFTEPGKINIAGEAGRELVLPIGTDGGIKSGTQGYADLMSLMSTTTAGAAVQTPQSVPLQQSVVVDLSELTEKLTQLISNANDQLEKQDEMLRAMQDTKDYTQRLFDVMA